MRWGLVWFLLCLGLVLATGFQNCSGRFKAQGSPNDDIIPTSSLLPNSGVLSSLEGDYKVSCSDESPLEWTISFTGNVFSQLVEPKFDCDSEALFAIMVSTNFEIKNESEESGLRRFDVNLMTESYGVIMPRFGSSWLNLVNFCGKNDWVNQQSQEIEDLSECDDWLTFGLYGLSMDGSELYIGDPESGNGRVVENRPSEFDSETVLLRIR